MPISTCHTCGGHYQWDWEDAFDKFGFGDGDGQVETDTVVAVLENAGYRVEAQPWGLHNVIILSIKDRSGTELIADTVTSGYDAPRSYLPRKIVRLLDRELGQGGAS
jgi:hypothetical protein